MRATTTNYYMIITMMMNFLFTLQKKVADFHGMLQRGDKIHCDSLALFLLELEMID